LDGTVVGGVVVEDVVVDAEVDVTGGGVVGGDVVVGASDVVGASVVVRGTVVAVVDFSGGSFATAAMTK
jgi:hypothetical protein